MRGDVLGVVLAHQLGGAGHHAVDTGGADEHVVRLLLEHELAGARERVERRLLQRAELVLPVPVGEVGEHEERQPVGRLLVERAEDARRVDVAGVALQQRLGLLAARAAEVGVQQVDHRPEVTAFLDVHLEQVAQVVQRRRGLAEAALLLDRRGLGVALDDDEPLQVGAVLAGHLLPDGLALLLAERDAPVVVALGEEHAPAVVLHHHVVEVRPALAAHGDGRAQVDVLGGHRGAHRLPPVEEVGLPALQRPLQPPVARQVDVVRDLLGVVDRHLVTPACGRSRPCGPCRSGAAPRRRQRRWAARRSSSATP